MNGDTRYHQESIEKRAVFISITFEREIIHRSFMFPVFFSLSILKSRVFRLSKFSVSPKDGQKLKKNPAENVAFNKIRSAILISN